MGILDIFKNKKKESTTASIEELLQQHNARFFESIEELESSNCMKLSASDSKKKMYKVHYTMLGPILYGPDINGEYYKQIDTDSVSYKIDEDGTKKFTIFGNTVFLKVINVCIDDGFYTFNGYSNGVD